MLVRVDPRSEQPIYVQIASSIASQIEHGSIDPGDRLPSARALASSLGVNMHTVLKAYAHLQERSLVQMRRGRGGVVVTPAPDLESEARDLARVARREGMSCEQLRDLITSVWKRERY